MSEKLDLELKIKIFENMSFTDYKFISERAENILIEYNLKESKKEFSSKNKERKRFFVDLRIGVLYIIDRQKMKESFGTVIDWEGYSDTYKKCVVMIMMSNNPYNGYMTNYQYELANLFCDFLNYDEKLLSDLLNMIPKFNERNFAFFMDSKDSKRFDTHQYILCSYKEYIEQLKKYGK